MSVSVDDICNFLKKRGLDDATLKRLQAQRIDGHAVTLLSNDQLRTLGITAIGDIVTVQEFVRNQDKMKPSMGDTNDNNCNKTRFFQLEPRARRREILKEMRSQSQSKSISEEHRVPGRPKSTIRSIKVGLRTHRGTSRFVQVRSPLGDGNTLTAALHVECTYDEILNELTSSIFPGGTNPRLGKLDKYHRMIVNTSNEVINKDFPEFTLGGYIDRKMLAGQLSLHLLCTPKEEDIPTLPVVITDSEDEFISPLKHEEHQRKKAKSQTVCKSSTCVTSKRLKFPLTTTTETGNFYLAGIENCDLTTCTTVTPNETLHFASSVPAAEPCELVTSLYLTENQPTTSHPATMATGNQPTTSQPVTMATENHPTTSQPVTMATENHPTTSQPVTMATENHPTTSQLTNDMNSYEDIEVIVDQCWPIMHVMGTTESGDENMKEIATETLPQALERLRTKIKSEKNIINVDRKNVLDGALRGYRRKGFDVWKACSVKFSGEIGIDGGGPSREFYRLLMETIMRLPLFSQDYPKSFVWSYPCFDENMYYLVGLMMAHGIIHSGQSPCFLSSTTYDIMAGQAEPKITDIHEADFREMIEKIADAKNQAEFDTAVNMASLLISVAGCERYSFTISRKDEMIAKLQQFLVVERLWAPMTQFMKGLNMLNVQTEIQQNSSIWKDVFVPTNQTKLDPVRLETLFEIEHSIEGSNRYFAEIQTLSWWSDFLMDLDEDDDVMVENPMESSSRIKLKLEDVLIFATGSSSVPAGGFNPIPKLKFRHPSDLQDDPTQEFAYGNTCSNTLSLPVLGTYSIFKERLLASFAIKSFTTH